MSNFVEVYYLPKKKTVDNLALLRNNSSVICDCLNMGPGEEHDSAHYVEDVYLLWSFGEFEIKFFLADEEGMAGWLAISIQSSNEDCAEIGAKLKNCVANIAEDVRFRIR